MESAESATRERLSGLRVLLVEDVDAIRQLVRWVLETEGAMVVEAINGREACELAGGQTVDVVVTDLGLPDMSGAAVVKGIRSASRGRIPIVVVSGAGPQDLADALEIGAERAFSKPMDLEDLIRYLACHRRGRVGTTRRSRARR
jgi:two-component system KDP operon response regulator KdpE